MEIMGMLAALNDVGMSPAAIALIGILWKQDRRLTIIETMLKGIKYG